MIAFLPRLFRHYRAKESVWLVSDELQRRLTASDQLMPLASPMSSLRHLGICRDHQRAARRTG
jgi:hypothetical protein